MEKHVNGFVFVSNELKKFKRPILDVPNIVIGNGLKIRKKQENTVVNNSVVFIGSKEHYWNGFELIEDLSQKNLDIMFHIIGIEGQSKSNLQFHGKLEEEKAQKIISNAVAAISTLALFRKGMIEASPLKSRLYMSLEIPFIYSLMVIK